MGQPLRGATVTAGSHSCLFSCSFFPVASTQTGADGSYSLSVEAGVYRVVATAVGYASSAYMGQTCYAPGINECGAEAQSTVGVNSAGETVAGIDLWLQVESVISGRIIDAATGLPAQGARVVLNTPGAVSHTFVLTDAAGQFRFERLRDMPFAVRADPLDTQRTSTLFPDTPCDTRNVDCEFPSLGLTLGVAESRSLGDIRLYQGARLVVSLRDSVTNAPVNERIAIHDANDVSQVAYAHSTPAEPGIYRSRTLVPGPVKLVFGYSGDPYYLRQLHAGVVCGQDCDLSSGTPVLLVAGQTTALEVALEPSRTVRGRVTDTSGAPLAGIEVAGGTAGQMLLEAHLPARFNAERTALTGSTGEFELTGMRSGSVLIRTRANGAFVDAAAPGIMCSAINLFCQGTGLALAQVPADIGTLVLAWAGSIAGTVYTPGTLQPAADIQVVLLHPISLQIALRARTDAAGYYQFDGLPAGDYIVLAETVPVAEAYPGMPCRFPVYATKPLCRETPSAGVTLAAAEHRGGIDFLGTDVVFWDGLGGEE